jgi:pyridoxine 5-phosphate synthase
VIGKPIKKQQEMVRLSVNINKIATLRNARGGNVPDLIKAAVDCERFGAQGITVHPRPDQRHIRYDDVFELKKALTTEFNIEGNPTDEFIDLVLKAMPAQVTLVPDDPGQLTSDHGWDTVRHKERLKEIIEVFHANKIRTSIFVDPDVSMVLHAKDTGTDRVEIYTESYAREYAENRDAAIGSFILAAEAAATAGLGINAGHDLNLENLKFFASHIPGLLEVSIGHALISDALYLGLENSIQLYRRLLV